MVHQPRHVARVVNVAVSEENRPQISRPKSPLGQRMPDPAAVPGKAGVEQHHAVTVDEQVRHAHQPANGVQVAGPVLAHCQEFLRETQT